MDLSIDNRIRYGEKSGYTGRRRTITQPYFHTSMPQDRSKPPTSPMRPTPLSSGAVPYRVYPHETTAADIARLNRARARTGEVRFQSTRAALADIESGKPCSQARLLSWASHPDERIAIEAALNGRRLMWRAPTDEVAYKFVDALGQRALMGACSEGVLWTPLLDAISCGEPYGLSHWFTNELRRRRVALCDWVRAQADGRLIEPLFGFLDWPLRCTMVASIRTLDAPLAARLVAQHDSSVILFGRPGFRGGDRPWTPEAWQELRFFRRSTLELVAGFANHDHPLDGALRLLSSLCDKMGRLTPHEADALIACVAPLAKRGDEDAHWHLMGVLISRAGLTSEQIESLYGLGLQLPEARPDDDGSPAFWDSKRLYSLLGEERAPVAFVAEAASKLSDEEWIYAEDSIARHPEAVLLPAIRARLHASEDLHVLLALCRSADDAEEFIGLYHRVLGMRTRLLPHTDVERSVVELLEAEPRLLRYLRGPDLQPLLTSATPEIRTKAMLFIEGVQAMV